MTKKIDLHFRISMERSSLLPNILGTLFRRTHSIWINLETPYLVCRFREDEGYDFDFNKIRKLGRFCLLSNNIPDTNHNRVSKFSSKEELSEKFEIWVNWIGHHTENHWNFDFQKTETGNISVNFYFQNEETAVLFALDN